MIKLSNGHTLTYVVASGALAFDGKGWPWERPLVWLGLIQPELFTVFIKSLTRNPRTGNLKWWKPWTCVRLIRGGAVNKVGLTNPGIDWWCKEVGPRIDFSRYAVAGSIVGNEEELVDMARRLNNFDLAALEVNYSCPNAGPLASAYSVIGAVKAVKNVSRHPVIIKISVDQPYLEIAAGLKDVAEAVSLNSVPWKAVFGDKLRTPLHRLERRVGGGGGGVSGFPAQVHNWFAASKLATQGALPVIAPSIMQYEDMARVRDFGAKAVSFGAIHLRTPWNPTVIVKKEKNSKN